jgi:hypothetical protein
MQQSTIDKDKIVDIDIVDKTDVGRSLFIDDAEKRYFYMLIVKLKDNSIINLCYTHKNQFDALGAINNDYEKILDAR